MTTTIRGKSGKSALRELLDQHDQCSQLIEQAKCMLEPLQVIATDSSNPDQCMSSIDISRDELVGILQARLQVINTKLENLGLKIGDEVENAQ